MATIGMHHEKMARVQKMRQACVHKTWHWRDEEEDRPLHDMRRLIQKQHPSEGKTRIDDIDGCLQRE